MILTKEHILYQDENLIAVNKPVDLPVHKNEFMPADAPYLTKAVGAITNQSVYPVHRLDSKTSGVIILAFSREIASLLSKAFEQRKVQKTYKIICKGNPEEGVFEQAVLIKKKKKRQAASTHYKTIFTINTHISYKQETDVSLSLVEAKPQTGRWHQLRQHFAGNRTDILGDTQHGDWTLNKIMTELCGVKRLLLHASKLELTHPVNGETLEIEAPLPEDFETVLTQLKEANYNS